MTQVEMVNRWCRCGICNVAQRIIIPATSLRVLRYCWICGRVTMFRVDWDMSIKEGDRATERWQQ